MLLPGPCNDIKSMATAWYMTVNESARQACYALTLATSLCYAVFTW